MGGGHSSQQQPPPDELHLSQNEKKIKDIAYVLDIKAKSQNPLLRQKDIDWDQHEQDKENVRLLKGLFKTLDPSIIRQPGDTYGQLQLSFKYETKRQLLLVKVIQCRDLCSRDVRTKAADPYVKLQMFPDAHNHGAKSTQIVVHTRNPMFNEIFAFRASEGELKEGRLVAQAWDYDTSSHDDFLGEVIVDTKSLDFEQQSVITSWFDLTMETDLNVKGELSVTLSYVTHGTLYVTLHGAHGLTPRSNDRAPHPFVKVAVPGVGAVHCTQIQRDTVDPNWEETFEFDVAMEELDFRYMVFHVVDETSLQSENHSMGQAILDLQVMTTQPSFHTTLHLADLRNSDRLQNKQQQQVVTQEFREACLAHTASRHPSFLFQQHTGCKTFKVSCRKAGRTSTMIGHMRIVDGVPVF